MDTAAVIRHMRSHLEEYRKRLIRLDKLLGKKRKRVRHESELLNIDLHDLHSLE